MKIASKKFIKTPPTMISRRCQAGFERNSHGLAGCFICSVSIDSSIIPEIFTYPPKGTQPIPYSVSLFFGLNLNKENHGAKNM